MMGREKLFASLRYPLLQVCLSVCLSAFAGDADLVICMGRAPVTTPAGVEIGSGATEVIRRCFYNFHGKKHYLGLY